MIRVRLNCMFSDEYFDFETVEKFTEAAVFFVNNKKSFEVTFTNEEDKDNENGDQ